MLIAIGIFGAGACVFLAACARRALPIHRAEAPHLRETRDMLRGMAPVPPVTFSPSRHDEPGTRLAIEAPRERWVA